MFVAARYSWFGSCALAPDERRAIGQQKHPRDHVCHMSEGGMLVENGGPSLVKTDSPADQMGIGLHTNRTTVRSATCRKSHFVRADPR
jgi:hypothetical protein